MKTIDFIRSWGMPTILMGALVSSLTIVALYRLTFHPLAKIPGPKLAAITGAYDFYWDCVKRGQYVFKIQQMHKKYGPIVRVNPWEVHIDDAAFFDTLYSKSKLDKHIWFYRGFGHNEGVVATVPWELHRARRGAMAKYFSSANVNKLEPLVQSRVRKLLDRFEEHRKAGMVIDVSNAFRCYAVDIIFDYAAPRTKDFLSTSDFAATFNKVVRDFSGLLAWHRHIPIVFPMLEAIPRSVISWTDDTGRMTAIMENEDELLRQAQAVIENKGIPAEKQAPTVLDAIYTSTLIRPEDKTIKRLVIEIRTLLGAGTETTGNALAVLTYYLLSQPTSLERLKAELGDAACQSQPTELMDYRSLEKLPWLRACIREALRLAVGVTSRLPRLHRTESIIYTTPEGKTYNFAPKTVISMSILDLHYNESIFPEATVFRPERWIESDSSKLRQMERAFAPWGCGPRQCLGLELAKKEIVLMAGNLFHQFNFKLFETTERDVQMVHDYFSPWGFDDSKGVRVVAT